MTELTKNDARQFMGMPIGGDEPVHRSRRNYTPRPIEELYPYFKEAFAKGVKAATWHQYTPYFNDGEPCEFSVYDLSVTNNEEVAEQWLDGNFYEDRLVEISEKEYADEKAFVATQRWSYFPYEEIEGKYFRRYEEGAYDYIPGSSHPDGISDVELPINDLEFEDALRTVFGDHTQVVVTPERVVQFDYEHE